MSNKNFYNSFSKFCEEQNNENESSKVTDKELFKNSEKKNTSIGNQKDIKFYTEKKNMKINLFKTEIIKNSGKKEKIIHEKKEQNKVNTENNNNLINNNMRISNNIQGIENDICSSLFDDYTEQINNNELAISLSEQIHEIDIENSQNVYSNSGYNNSINNINNISPTDNNMIEDSIYDIHFNIERKKTKYIFVGDCNNGE